MRLKYYLLAIFCVLMCACKAPKDVIYFQGIDDLTPDELAEMIQGFYFGKPVPKEKFYEAFIAE